MLVDQIHSVMHFTVKFCHFCRSYLGLLRWLSCKESSCKFRTCSFDPWVGKIPWRRKWQPSPVFLPGESHGQRSRAGYSPWGCKGLDTTERLSTYAWTQVLLGEGVTHFPVSGSSPSLFFLTSSLLGSVLGSKQIGSFPSFQEIIFT